MAISMNIGGNDNAKNRLSAATAANGAMKPLDEELQEAAEELKKKQKEDLKQLKHLDLSAYQVRTVGDTLIQNIVNIFFVLRGEWYQVQESKLLIVCFPLKSEGYPHTL